MGELSESFDDCSLPLLSRRCSWPQLEKESLSGYEKTKEDVYDVQVGVQVTTGVHRGSRSRLAGV